MICRFALVFALFGSASFCFAEGIAFNGSWYAEGRGSILQTFNGAREIFKADCYADFLIELSTEELVFRTYKIGCESEAGGWTTEWNSRKYIVDHDTLYQIDGTPAGWITKDSITLFTHYGSNGHHVTELETFTRSDQALLYSFDLVWNTPIHGTVRRTIEGRAVQRIARAP